MRTIGRYIVTGILGKGGMSTVYKVAMPVTGKIVALKLFSPPDLLVDIVGEEDLRRLFIAEAVTMANLRHPHIADVWDCAEHDGRPFFIMEYFCNNLGHIIGEGEDPAAPGRAIAPDKVFRYGGQLLDGLSCLHQAGIIHRDIKPFNLLLTDQDTIKIADFGLSKQRGDKLAAPDSIRIGSPFFTAPEQEKNPDTVDERADLHAAGVTIFRMLHGVLPGRDAPTPASPDVEELFTLWRPFFKQATAPDRKDRFRSAAVMRKELLRLEKEWRQQRADYCRVFAPTFDEPAGESTPLLLRSEPAKVNPKRAMEIFQVDDLWRPRRLIMNDFRDNGDGTVVDLATSLVWQQDGSDYPMNWHRAGNYITDLNRRNWRGQNDWRLPTVDELLSLLPNPLGDMKYCRESLFGETQKWLWSADCRSAVASWYINVEMGFLAWQDHSCSYFVRAVRNNLQLD